MSSFPRPRLVIPNPRSRTMIWLWSCPRYRDSPPPSPPSQKKNLPSFPFGSHDYRTGGSRGGEWPRIRPARLDHFTTPWKTDQGDGERVRERGSFQVRIYFGGGGRLWHDTTLPLQRPSRPVISLGVAKKKELCHQHLRICIGEYRFSWRNGGLIGNAHLPFSFTTPHLSSFSLFPQRCQLITVFNRFVTSSLKVLSHYRSFHPPLVPLRCQNPNSRVLVRCLRGNFWY